MPDQKKSMKPELRKSPSFDLDRLLEQLACQAYVPRGKRHPILTNHTGGDIVYEGSIGADEPFRIGKVGQNPTSGEAGMIQIVGTLKTGESLIFFVAPKPEDAAESAGITHVGWTLRQSSIPRHD